MHDPYSLTVRSYLVNELWPKIKSYGRGLGKHGHDPETCYQCHESTKAEYLPELQAEMPADQRRVVEALRVNIRLGLMRQEKAVALYNKHKRAARWL